MRSRYKITDKDGVYFITSTIVEWIPVFTSKPFFDILLSSFRFCRDKKGLKIYAFVILDNHFHAVVSGEELSRTIQALKSFTATEITALLQQRNRRWMLNQFAYFRRKHKSESRHQVWQEGYHPQLILNEKMLVQKIEYIHANPIRRGLVELPEHWLHSSARNFVFEDDSVLEIDPLPI